VFFELFIIENRPQEKITQTSLTLKQRYKYFADTC